MSLNPSSALYRQIAAVRRRLFLSGLVRTIIWGWFAALALAVVWFFAEPLLLAAPPAWLRWTILAAALVLGTAIPIAYAVWRRPSAVRAALALDEQFRLRERVTTSLLLRPDEAESPAGAALLADANQRVDNLRVGDRFPVRVPWTAALVPACAVALGLLIWLYHPSFGQAAVSKPQAAANTDAMKAEIDKVQQQLQAKREAQKKDPAKSADLQKIEAEIDKMLSNKHETKDQVRDDIKKGDDILDDLKKQDKARDDAARALKERLEELERARKKEDQQKREDGPAKDLAKAMDQGDLAQAKQEADQLAKKLEAQQEADALRKKLDDPNLKPDEKKELQDELKKKEDEGLNKDDADKLKQQLQDMKDDAEDLSKKNEDDQKKLDEEEKKVDEDAKKDGADKDQLQKEKDQLEKDKQQLKQQQQGLQQLGQKLGQAQQAMQQGKNGDAAQQLKEAGDQMGKLSNEGERKEIAQDMQQVQQMKKSMSQALAKQEQQENAGKQGDQGGKQGDQGNQAGKQGDKGGDQAGNQGGNAGQPGNQGGQGPNPGGAGSGARPEGQDMKTGEEEHHANSQTDDKGRLEVVDKVDGPHDRFTGPKKPSDMTDEIRRAAQEGAAASEHERLTDKATAEMAKGFFEKLRPPDKGDDKKPAPKP